MLNAQLHYPVFTYEYRASASQVNPIGKRGLRRIFRLDEGRGPRRETRSR
ncbi:MAG TPA: hypothetical protein VFH98_08730 [Candidatus Limnocylindria bacterium]|jgi:hypothetical protein|nr:hypothetical protein [Candidatus Limnocylindria bacterium]